jgi:tetratricopeptide (TPR) repeat protein
VYVFDRHNAQKNKKDIIMAIAKNADEYIEHQRAAIASNPECGTSHYNLAVGLLGQKNYEEAEKELFLAIECSPTLAEAYVQLGGLCLQRGDLDGCFDFNQRAVKVRPGFSEGHSNMGFVHLQKGNIDEAITSLERAVAFNFRFVQAFATLGNAYLMKGRLDDSIKTSLKALELEPTFAVVHNNLAIAYLEKGEYVKAVEHCDKALENGYNVADEILKEMEAHR